MGTLREICISLDPVEAIDMDRESAEHLAQARVINTALFFHLDLVDLSSVLDERPIEIVAIECDEDERLGLSNVLEESYEQSFFVWLIEYFEEAIDAVLGLGAILKVLDILTDDLSVGDQEAFTVNDVRDHHDLVKL